MVTNYYIFFSPVAKRWWFVYIVFFPFSAFWVKYHHCGTSLMIFDASFGLEFADFTYQLNTTFHTVLILIAIITYKICEEWYNNWLVLVFWNIRNSVVHSNLLVFYRVMTILNLYSGSLTTMSSLCIWWSSIIVVYI